jgi:hypothetical protein
VSEALPNGCVVKLLRDIALRADRHPGVTPIKLAHAMHRSIIPEQRVGKCHRAYSRAAERKQDDKRTSI